MSTLAESLARVPLEDLLSEIRRRRVLIETAEAEAEQRDKWRAVTRAVARAWDLPAAALWRPGRANATTQPRQAAMVLMREQLGMTFEDIGAVFHKDHGTAIHALHHHASRMTAPDYRRCFETARTLLAGV